MRLMTYLRSHLVQIELSRWQGALKDEDRRTRLLFILDGALINAAIVLTSGIFLSGYVVYLGGPDFLVGLLNNSLTWAMIASFFSFMVFERLEKRKKLLISLLGVSRLLIAATIFLPLVIQQSATTLLLLTVMVIVSNILWGAYHVGSTVWLMSSVPRDIRTNFIFRRIFFLRITYTFFIILMGFVLDWSGKSYWGFLVVFLTSLLLSLGDVALLARIPEPASLAANRKTMRLGDLAEPLRDRPFLRYLAFIFLFQFCMTLSTSFTPLYLIRYLQFDYKVISIASVITNLFMIAATRPWGRIDGRMHPHKILQICGFLTASELLLYAFLNSQTAFLIYLAPILAGIGGSGFNAFVFTYRYELMPEQNRTVYESVYCGALGLAVLLGPVAGGLVMGRLPLYIQGQSAFSKFQLMYAVAFVLVCAVLLLLLKVPPSGSTPRLRAVFPVAWLKGRCRSAKG
jgi:MFS family permease